MIASEFHQDSLFIQGIFGIFFPRRKKIRRKTEKDEENLVTTILYGESKRICGRYFYRQLSLHGRFWSGNNRGLAGSAAFSQIVLFKGQTTQEKHPRTGFGHRPHDRRGLGLRAQLRRRHGRRQGQILRTTKEKLRIESRKYSGGEDGFSCG